MCKWNVSQRRLFYTQKQMFDNKKNTEKIILGVIYLINWRFRYFDINL